MSMEKHAPTTSHIVKRWTALEPGRCIVYPNDRAINVLRHGKWPFVGFMGDELSEDIINGAASESIEARGWDWERFMTLERPFVVYDKSHITPSGLWPKTTGYTLLEAYVLALEAYDWWDKQNNQAENER